MPVFRYRMASGATGRRTRRPVPSRSTGLGVPRPVAPTDAGTIRHGHEYMPMATHNDGIATAYLLEATSRGAMSIAEPVVRPHEFSREELPISVPQAKPARLIS